ncbi:hypothetical protein GCM10022261_24880 [Brevibacterium daeguense]|uniref:Uncharacterized protein n=1 Tax=Brevibacterium daeguense TaxID=909936 RepID=A0ABP8ELZ9_9MICO|nr:hypothetical protein [Brevibacterium daeguense]
MSTEPRWFARPGVLDPDHPGTLNPVYEVLDYPIVLGRADETCMTAEASAGAAPAELSYETVLERVAKLAGVLRLLDVRPGVPVRIGSDVPALPARLARLAVIRIGGLLVEDPAAEARVAFSAAEDEPTRDVHQAFSKPVRRLPSYYEGVQIATAERSVALDPVVRDPRIEPGAAAQLPADLVVIRRADGTEVTARELIGELDLHS